MPGFGIARGIGFGVATRTDPDAAAYISAIGDLPTAYQQVVNLLVVDLKTYGLWTKLKFGLLPAITLNDADTLIDLKTTTTLSGAALKGQDEVGFDRILTCPIPIGFYLKASTEHIKTGAIPSAIHTVNDTCIAHGILENVTGGSKFFYSAQQSTSALITGNLRTAGNSSIIDSYTTTANAGRNTFGGGTVTDVSGRWIHNRRSATDVELYRNGVSVGSAANGGGSLPNVEMYIGAQNNAGTPGAYANHICPYHLQFSGLTATERNNLETVLVNYYSNLGTLGTLDRNLVWDGNSLSVYENWNVVRAASYYAYSTGKKLYRTRNVAVQGNTTTQRLAAYPAGAGTEFQAGYSKNIYVIWEIRNDLYIGGVTTAQAKTNISDLVALAKATGYTVVVVPPHLATYVGNSGRTETQWNLAIDEMYTYVQANSFGADYVIQITDTDLWVPRSEFGSDAAYNTAVAAKVAGSKYFDGTHLNPSGGNSIGQIIANQSLDLIG